jgi:hypothetical protein
MRITGQHFEIIQQPFLVRLEYKVFFCWSMSYYWET